MANDLTKGTTYEDGMMLNAANLNAHVDDAVLKSTAISARTAKATGAVTDEFLINDGGTLKKMTGSVLYDMVTQPGAVIQSAYGSYIGNDNLSAIIPLDDTLPQISEGSAVVNASLAARSVNSRIVLRFTGVVSASVPMNVVVAMFVGAGVNAQAATTTSAGVANGSHPIAMITTLLPASTASITYSVRAGPDRAGSIRFNGSTSARYFGGVMAVTLEAQEVRIP